MSKEAVTIIGGADGPASVFIAGASETCLQGKSGNDTAIVIRTGHEWE